MATKIINKFGFEVSGELASFDEGNDTVIFTFRGGSEVEIKNVSKEMLISLSRIGLVRLANAEINFVKNNVNLKKKVDKIFIPKRQPIASASLGVG